MKNKLGITSLIFCFLLLLPNLLNYAVSFLKISVSSDNFLATTVNLLFGPDLPIFWLIAGLFSILFAIMSLKEKNESKIFPVISIVLICIFFAIIFTEIYMMARSNMGL